MILTLKQVSEILQKEIDEYLGDPDNEHPREMQVGFANGLRQAKHLIEKEEETILLSEGKDYLEIHPRLRPLANIAKELKDDELQDCISYVAYLNYRRRIFKMANDIWPDRDGLGVFDEPVP